MLLNISSITAQEKRYSSLNMLTFCERHLNTLLQHVLTKFSLTSSLSIHTECVERETVTAGQ